CWPPGSRRDPSWAAAWRRPCAGVWTASWQTSEPPSCARRWRGCEVPAPCDAATVEIRPQGLARGRLLHALETAVIRVALPGTGQALFTARADGNLSTLRGRGHERGRLERERLREDLGLRRLCAGRHV